MILAASPDPTYFGLTGGWWGVIGVIATSFAFLAGAVVAIAAFLQIRQSKQVRLDQARPYVLVTIEESAFSQSMLELVIRNVGAGPAKDVRIEVDPPLRRADETAGYSLASARIFNQPVEMLPPGFELRSFFDSTIDRHQTRDELPSQHTVTLNYNDGHGHEFKNEKCTLDLTLYEGLLYSQRFGIHHAAAALREIATAVKRSPTLKGTVDVRTETRSEAAERAAEDRAEMERRYGHSVEDQAPGAEPANGLDSQPEPSPEQDSDD